MSGKSYILWCSRGYCAVPIFLRVFPVSAPCLSSSFKSIYCSLKSIRLSEERCRFSGYGSLILHFLSLFLILMYRGKKKSCDSPSDRHVRVSFVCVCVLVTMRKKCHTTLKKRVQAEPFPLTAKSMEQVFHFLSQTHKKHFYARSNHISPCHHHYLGQSCAYQQPHFWNNAGNSLSSSQSHHPS